MTALSLLRLLLSLYGLAWVVSSSRLTLGIRMVLGRHIPILAHLMECVGCFGFWEGVAVSAARGDDVSMWWPFGLAVAASNLMLHSLFLIGDAQHG